MTTPRIRRGRFEAGLVGVAGADGLGHGVVDFEDDALGAVVAVLRLVLTLDDGEGVHDVGHGVARGREAGLEPRLVLRRFALRRAPGLCRQLDALVETALQDGIHDGDDIGETLPGARPRGEDIVVTALGGVDCFELVLMELQAGACIMRSRLDAKDLRALGVEHFPMDQLVDPGPFGEGGIEADAGLGPEEAALQVRLDTFADAGISNRNEALDVGAVVRDHAIAEVEDVHDHPYSSASVSDL